MPKEPQQKLNGPRQRPVSCKFCRTRKLRCSRESPCSNCLSRGITCELEQTGSNGTASDDSDKAELLERIRKLEGLVQQGTQTTALPSITVPTVSNLLPNPLNSHVSGTFGDVAKQSQSSSIPSPTVQLDRDFAWLESIYDGTDHSSDAIPSTKVGFRVCSVQFATEVEQFILGSSSSDPSIIFWLPEYSEAKILLDKFVKDVEHIHHIVLTQSLPATLDRTYSTLSQQGQVKSGDMILLLSIFAAAIHSWTPEDCRTRGLFTTPEDPKRRSALWVKATEDLLDVAHRTTRMSIEGIQGIIIVTMIVASYKGFSRRAWFLMSNALALAREIGLHCIDHPSNADLANTAEAEVARRVWWYLVASDWAMATKYNGLARGTYQCHKRHMMTNKPVNLDDEDVFDGMPRIGRPMSQPTQMTYFLLRIRLNEICRSIVDRAPLMSTLPSGTSYEVVMDIDTEMQLLLNDIPDFFSMAPAQVASRFKLSSWRAKVIARQGHDFRTFFHATRCKLHLPYARRGFTEPDFATSRVLCIDSARLIIQTEYEYQRLHVNTGFSCYKPLMYSLTVFLACTVLLMEYCHRKQSPSSEHHEKQRVEISHALSMLEAARSQSEIASKFLDSLVTVLRKHGIAPPKRIPQQAPPTVPSGSGAATQPFTSAAESTLLPMSPMSGLQMPTPAAGGEVPSTAGFATVDTESDLNHLVRSLDQGVDVGMIEWDDIFLGLGDSSFM